MASERLVAQAKSALLQHYQAHRPQRRLHPRTLLVTSLSNAYDEEREACAWAHEFVQLLADYDFTVGGSSKRDADVKAWVGQVEGETKGSPLAVSEGGRVGGREDGGYGSVGEQDPVPSSDPAVPLALSALTCADSKDSSESSVEDGWEDMNRYMAVPNWDYLVDRIHRVERSAVTGEIMVYFTSRHGEKIKETGQLCKARLPKKVKDVDPQAVKVILILLQLLAFYEENLRWDNDVVNGHH